MTQRNQGGGMTDEEHAQLSRRVALKCAVRVFCGSRGDPRTIEEIRDARDDDHVVIRMAKAFTHFIEEG
jgi:hypothetical protein